MRIVKRCHHDSILENTKDKQNPNYPLAKLRLTQSLVLYAQAFAELHSLNLSPIKNLIRHEVKYFIDKIYQIHDSLIKYHEHFDHLDLTLLKQYIDHTIKNFLERPGYYSYTHGDPNFGNFFLQLERNHLTMIDTAHLAGKWMDKVGLPKGFAANEFMDANSMIALLCHRFSIPEEDISELQTIFGDAYRESAKKECLSSEAINFFHLFWLFREINTPLRVLENDEGRREFVPDVGLLGRLIERVKEKIGQHEEERKAFKI